MGLITEEVEVTAVQKNIKYFENLGYDIPKRIKINSNGKEEIKYDLGKKFLVKVEDLPKGSNIKVRCECDYCNKPMDVIYNEYVKKMNGIVPKICCKKCLGKKLVESNMITYGVKTTLELGDVQERIKKTLQNKYGVDHPSKSKEIREKRLNTFQSRYGVSNASQVPEFQEKKKQSCLKTTGYEYPLQSPQIQEEMKKKMLDLYGGEYSLQCPSICEKIRKTNLEKYNCENAMQNKEIREKTNNTNLQRYGYKNPSQCPEIREKVTITLHENQTVATSTQQKYIAYLYSMELNYPILYWNVDMYDEENNLVVEYDGGGHFLDVELGETTQEEFDNKELVREKLIRQDGHKIMRIISKTDKLPSDQILLQMLSDAKQYFKDYPKHSWINFDINNGIIRNAKNKEGKPYDYGQLRKIKKTDLESA